MKYKRGIISLIVLILIALIILGYFKINIQTVIGSPFVKDNIAYAWNLLVGAVVWAWNMIRQAFPH